MTDQNPNLTEDFLLVAIAGASAVVGALIGAWDIVVSGTALTVWLGVRAIGNINWHGRPLLGSLSRPSVFHQGPRVLLNDVLTLATLAVASPITATATLVIRDTLWARLGFAVGIAIGLVAAAALAVEIRSRLSHRGSESAR